MIHPRHILIIYSTFILAFILTLLPLPDILAVARPDWLILILIYWCLAKPELVGIITAFVLGLLLDIAVGTLLGQYALCCSLIAYLVLKNHQRLRIMPRLQQSLVVMLLLLLKQWLFLWIYGITGRAPDNIWWYFSPVLLGAILWPLVFTILKSIRRRFIGSGLK